MFSPDDSVAEAKSSVFADDALGGETFLPNLDAAPERSICYFPTPHAPAREMDHAMAAAERSQADPFAEVAR